MVGGLLEGHSVGKICSRNPKGSLLEDSDKPLSETPENFAA